MTERQVRNLHSSKMIPPLFCTVRVEGEKVFLISKDNKNQFREISWEDVQYQVESAIKEEKTSPYK